MDTTPPPHSSAIVWHHATVTRARREKQNHHPGMVLWFTGLSGSGKSTLAHALEEHLHQQGCHTFVLDGDNIRHGLCRDLGFSAQDRQENIRRISEVAKLFVEAGLITLAAFISPFQADRHQAKTVIGRDNFVEIYCLCPLTVCEKRDRKGLYKKARAGLIQDFTGISSPYEEPDEADLVLNTATHSVEACVAQLLAHLETPLSKRL
ncbi:MAG: adenylyl-sulfate kinase, partial [Magnetococcales bacterium]|nr:adenylyl-sulfate kinase [Magnetococcales bacterium]